MDPDQLLRVAARRESRERPPTAEGSMVCMMRTTSTASLSAVRIGEWSTRATSRPLTGHRLRNDQVDGIVTSSPSTIAVAAQIPGPGAKVDRLRTGDDHRRRVRLAGAKSAPLQHHRVGRQSSRIMSSCLVRLCILRGRTVNFCLPPAPSNPPPRRRWSRVARRKGRRDSAPHSTARRRRDQWPL